MTNLIFTILIRFLIVVLFVVAFYIVLVVENRSGMFSDLSIGGIIMGLVGAPYHDHRACCSIILYE